MPDAKGYGTPGSERGPVRSELERRVRAGDIQPDPIQAVLADRLDRLERELKLQALPAKSSALGWLFGKREKPAAPRGLYIHGSVGRGKSMMMDLFFRLSSEPRKRRLHFHEFMREAHERINAHRAAVKAGEAKGDDPIPPVAEAIAAEARLLCFDEFTVTDIADAMILSRLFDALFAQGVVLVATSNVAPDDLYRNGLNRPLFLPFVETLKSRADVFFLDAPTDYRMETVGGDDVYVTPLGPRRKHAWTRSGGRCWAARRRGLRASRWRAGASPCRVRARGPRASPLPIFSSDRSVPTTIWRSPRATIRWFWTACPS